MSYVTRFFVKRVVNVLIDESVKGATIAYIHYDVNKDVKRLKELVENEASDEELSEAIKDLITYSTL